MSNCNGTPPDGLSADKNFMPLQVGSQEESGNVDLKFSTKEVLVQANNSQQLKPTTSNLTGTGPSQIMQRDRAYIANAARNAVFSMLSMQMSKNNS